MQYKDIPSIEILNKVKALSFNTPRKNAKVFQWHYEVAKLAEFIENERRKLINKYGEEEKSTGDFRVLQENLHAFIKDFEEVLNLEIEIKLNKFPLDLEDLTSDESCNYPKDKSLWLSLEEFDKLIKFIEK